MQEMSHDEWRAFLLSKARTAKVAVVRKDGRPHVTPVWFDLDGDTVVFTTWHTSIKGAALRRNQRVCICVDEDQRPFSFVTLDGLAAISTEPGDLRYWAGRIGARYMGADTAGKYAGQNGVAGELLVRVTPVHVVARRGIGD